MTQAQLMIVTLGVAVALCLAIAIIIARSRRRVDAGHALVINRLREEPTVRFTDTIVIPVFQRAELVDLSVKRIVIARRGREGLICHDSMRVDIEATFLVRINRTVDDVLRVVNTIGATRAGNVVTLEELFTAKFSEALKTVASKLDLAELFTKREEFKDQVIMVVGKDLNGYVLDDVAIDKLEQTPVDQLDPTNVLDAQGIRKIRKLTGGAMPAPITSTDSFAKKLRDHGLLDVEVSVEVSCSAAPERAAIVGRVEELRDQLSKMPQVSQQMLEAIGMAELACRDGRATVRFPTSDVDDQQLLYAARLVHALRHDTAVFR